MKKTIFFGSLIVTATLIGACSPQTGEDVKITATSVLESFGPERLLKAEGAGWHAKTPPTYPQIVTFTLANPQQISSIGLLPQAGQLSRGPRKFVVEVSDDTSTWKEVATVENDCNAPAENWRDHSLGNAVSTKNVRIKILSNCGAPTFLTLRGVRFK